jgi:hypothetical protein
MKFSRDIKETKIRIDPLLVINNIEVRYFYDKDSVLNCKTYDFFCSLYGGEHINEWNKVDRYMCSCEKFCSFHECRYKGNYMTIDELLKLFEDVFPEKLDDVKLILNRIDSLKEFLRTKETNEIK